MTASGQKRPSRPDLLVVSLPPESRPSNATLTGRRCASSGHRCSISAVRPANPSISVERIWGHIVTAAVPAIQEIGQHVRESPDANVLAGNCGVRARREPVDAGRLRPASDVVRNGLAIDSICNR